MSISPQMRQLFMEIVDQELKFFVGERDEIDKDGLLASVLHTLNTKHPQHARAYYAEAAHMAGRALINDRLHKVVPFAFDTLEDAILAREIVQLPLEGTNKFIAKPTLKLMKAEVRLMRNFHRTKERGHNREGDFYESLLARMDDAGLGEDGLVEEVLKRAA